ncbi:MAG: DUF2203 domain-containing protein [Thermoleophilia bacterium]
MRHFTPEEAIAALPVVRPLVERLVATRRDQRAARQGLDPARRAVPTNGGGVHPATANDLRDRSGAATASLGQIVDEITGLGVQVKDLDIGLVDFPAIHPATGETVLLCWRLGEETITHWHGLDEGFAGRKPLPFA